MKKSYCGKNIQKGAAGIKKAMNSEKAQAFKREAKERLKRNNQPKFFKWLLKGSAVVVLVAGGVLTAGTMGVALPAWAILTSTILTSVGAGTGITSYLTKDN